MVHRKDTKTDNFTSSSDWPNNYPELRDLDGNLRCPICFDFINIAMMIGQCSHIYCSLCIRKYLSFQNKCPTCYIPATELDLKNCRVLDNIVNNFRSLRYRLLLLIEADCQQLNPSLEKRQQIQSPNSHKKVDPRNKDSHYADRMHPSRVDRSAQRKPGSAVNADKIVIDLSLEDEDEFIKEIKSDQELEEEKNKIVSSTPVVRKCHKIVVGPFSESTSSRSLHENKKKDIELVEEADDQDGQNERIPTSDDGNESAVESVDNPDVSVDPDKIPCPICSVIVRPQVINRHLDSCLAAKDKKTSLRSAIPKRKYLPKIVYNLMSDKDIRKKLKEIGLSSQGNREILIKRHHNFILAYNAECDSLKPRSAEEIVKELENKEKMCLSKKDDCHSKKWTMSKKCGTSIEHAQKVYLREHKSHFNSLIRETRNRIKKKKLDANKSTITFITTAVDEKSKMLNVISNNLSSDFQEQIVDDNSENSDNTEYKQKINGTKKFPNAQSPKSTLTRKKLESVFQKQEKEKTVQIDTESDDIINSSLVCANVENILALPFSLLSPKSVFALPKDIVSPRHDSMHVKKSTRKRNVMDENAGILEAGLSCRMSPLSKTRKQSVSPCKHAFVDDSASETGSEVGLIQKINSSINSFECEEAEEAVLSKYENLWPALNSRGERMRHVSEAESSDTSDIFPTAEETQEITCAVSLRPTRRSLSDTRRSLSDCNIKSQSIGSRLLRKRTRDKEDVEVEIPAKKRK